MRVRFSLQLLSEAHFSFYDKFSKICSKMCIGLHVKCPLFLSDFNETWIVSTNLRKNIEKSNFVKTRPVGTELFHEDGQIDITKLTVAFRNFANSPKNTLVRSVITQVTIRFSTDRLRYCVHTPQGPDVPRTVTPCRQIVSQSFEGT